MPDEKRVKIAYPDVINGHAEGHFPIRKARISDVENLLELVNGFAAQNLMLPRGPQYIFENIRDYVVIVDEARGRIVACGSLHVLWNDMAEIRSMAIHPDYQKRGLGRRLVGLLDGRGQAAGDQEPLHLYALGGIFRPAWLHAQAARRAAPQGLGRVQPLPEVLQVRRGRDGAGDLTWTKSSRTSKKSTRSR